MLEQVGIIILKIGYGIMFIGREKELQYLNNMYENPGSRIVVLYGQKYIGKTAIMKAFMADKDAYYYVARPASDKEQCIRMTEELSDLDIPSGTDRYETIFEAIAMQGKNKKILIIDEFQYMVKSSSEFMRSLVSLVKQEYSKDEVFVILVSSSVGWVENSMVKKIGAYAFEIKGFLKVRELSFDELCRFYPKYSVKQCMEVYSILGAVPGLMVYFDDRKSIQQNICDSILKKGCYLQLEGSRYVESELREISVYNTILSALASGKQKLNDLYHYTGFSRAKISVYLNNLIELEIVEKVFSVDTEGRENTMKGVYAIKNHFIAFWYEFIYPHLNRLEFMSEELYYDSFIAERLDSYCGKYFGMVCREILMKQSQAKRLPVTIRQIGAWYGKNGNLDIVATDEKGQTIVGICDWTKVITFADYEWLQYCEKQAKIEGNYYYLFGYKGFDKKLISFANETEQIRLIDINEVL